MRIAVIILAAGSGRRFGSDKAAPKQFMKLAGRDVVWHAARAFVGHVDIIQPVGDPEALCRALEGVATAPPVPGGATRKDSVRAGLLALDSLPAGERPDLVLVHDGARPYIPEQLIKNVLDGLAENAGAIPAIPVADTLKRGHDGYISETVSRETLFRVQTPQGFHYPLLLELHTKAAGLADDITDDAMLLEAAGHKVALVPGSEDNIKLTYREDMVRLERLFQTAMLPHTGLGYDVHAFADGRPLVLCGVTVPHERGLAGHSDADVGIHALCDAIYGALCEGDIGRHFPPTEASWKDADSARFLVHAGERIRARGGRFVNADITLICERPKIGPHAQAMQERLASLLEVLPSQISVKATTTERLGFTGRQEGIACQAVVSVMLPQPG